MATYVAEHLGYQHHVLEMFSGPGRIGFELLEQRLCSQLTLADINPLAISCCQLTIAKHQLSDRCWAHESDVFDHIPDSKFDLIIANPPNYENQHPDYSHLALRASDWNWQLHQRFYATAKRFLKPGGQILLSEVEPLKTEVMIGDLLYDQRTRVPLTVFKEQIEAGGLRFDSALEYLVYEGLSLVLVNSKRI